MSAAHLANSSEKVPVDMTPMIDVVFQLLIFFVMTLRIVEAEGDFRIQMPLGQGKNDVVPSESLPLLLELHAGQDGKLTAIHWNKQPVQNFDQLHQKIRVLMESDDPTRARQTWSVEIDSDPRLHYHYVMSAITSLAGERLADGTTRPLIEKISFKPPR